jgi:pimeloyl-ACP methyl ester carboxylesterase
VRSAAGKLAAALSAAFALAGLPAASAHAAIAFGPCPESNQFACGTLAVPLDPSGASPGTLTLTLRRHRSPVGEARSAVIALAGGPGQAALPITEEFTEILGPILSTRDLIVFDQRGTGSSNPLSCHAFEAAARFSSLGALVSACAAQIGAGRTFYASLDSVADIEAIRIAGGYEKLVLYGTSYGTKVAELYAAEHPEHVEAMVLDSVVPPTGPDPLNRATFAAVSRVLRSLCANHACARITADPVVDLGRVLRRMRGGPLHGRVIDGDGRAHTVPINSEELLEILIAGDLTPVLRAEFITAVRAAAGDDDAPLARLIARSEPAGAPEGIDLPLYFATTCEDQLFPWSRSGTAAARLSQARAALAALPAGAALPFTKADMLALSDMQACAYWPFATPAPPPPPPPLPNVPTLILSGADDLRTPTANARAVAAQIPDARLLVVPYTGHSVLTDEPTACAHDALLAQFAGKPIKRCPARREPPTLRPPALPPARLADVSPVRGVGGRPGRTLHALALTFTDLGRELGLQLLEMVATGRLSGTAVLRGGGLRAGWMRLAGNTLALHGYSYVPGVTISGEITPEEANLTIGGRAAARGTLRLGHHRTLIGTLEGEPVHLRTATLAAGAEAVTAGFGLSLSDTPQSARRREASPLAALEHSLAHLPVPGAGS